MNLLKISRWAIPPVLVLAGCASDGTESSQAELAGEIGSIGGATVDDTEIVHEQLSSLLRVGGVDVELDLFRRYTFSRSNTVSVPQSWPTLALREGNDDELGADGSAIGVAVLAQTELVTNEESREQLFAAAFSSTGTPYPDLVLDAVVRNTESGRECWVRTRTGQRANRPFADTRSVVLVAGPGVGSAGFDIFHMEEPADAAVLAGDIVDSICGSRPDGA